MDTDRLDIILGRGCDVRARLDDVAWLEHRCDGPECCPDAPPWDADDRLRVAARGWVYAIGDDNSVLYVGKTDGRLSVRMAQHMGDGSPVMARARRLGLYPEYVSAWNVGESCGRLERATLLILRPLLNEQGLA